MSVRISEEERLQRLREIREAFNDYPIIPVFKDEDELRWSLQHGNVDFIVNTEFYKGISEGGRGLVRPIKPWTYATEGFSIHTMSINSALGIVNDIAQTEKKHRFVYFRVLAPDMPIPRLSYVDEALRVLRETEAELSRSNLIRGDLHDY